MSRELNIQATWLLQATIDAYQSGKVGVLHEGGSRSSKTKSLCQFICLDLIKNKNKGLVYTLARSWRTHLDKTVWRDIKWALNQFRIPYKENLQKYTIEACGNLIQGVGFNDDPMLVFGLEQYFLWVNEANAVPKEAFDQAEQRTSGIWALDYNPKDLMHWCYDLESRNDVKLIKSTVLDNPFAPSVSRRKIESYNPDVAENIHNKTADPFKWKVFGLGERGASDEVIFKEFEYYRDSEEPKDEDCYLYVYGGDFGYSSPSAVVMVKQHGVRLYLKEVLYEAGLSNKGIAERLSAIKENIFVFDSAELKSIQELRTLDVNAYYSDKGQGSVYYGLQKLKNFYIYLHKDSENLIREFKTAKWAVDEKTGNLLKDNKGRPIHQNSKDFHCIAATRYAVTKFHTEYESD